MQVRLHPAARTELHEAAESYALRAGQRVASDFVSAYDEVRLRIVEYPQIGTPSVAATRKLRFRGFPYSLIYRLARDHIVILAIAHQRRRPRYWRNRQ
jgi:plasmid stabilization system protein ParE